MVSRRCVRWVEKDHKLLWLLYNPCDNGRIGIPLVRDMSALQRIVDFVGRVSEPAENGRIESCPTIHRGFRRTDFQTRQEWLCN